MTDNSEYLDKNDSLYVVSSTNNAYATYLASPSAFEGNYLLYNDYSIYVNRIVSNSTVGIGFRPLVCLNVDVKLENNGNGTYTIK